MIAVIAKIVIINFFHIIYIQSHHDSIIDNLIIAKDHLYFTLVPAHDCRVYTYYDNNYRSVMSIH